jgi:hypothetical protein
MYIDGDLIFEPVAGTLVTATADSTNVLDLGVKRDIGIGDNPALWVDVIALATFATGTSLTIALKASQDNATFFVLAQTEAIPVAVLLAGTILWQIPVPQESPDFNTATFHARYYKLTYTVGGSNFTTGSLWAGLLLHPQRNVIYPPGVAIAN